MIMLRGALLLALSLASQLLLGQAHAQVLPSLKASYCAGNQWPGSGPDLPAWTNFKAWLCPGQLFRSPNGFYTALLRDDGEWIVARGDPSNAANLAWRTGITGRGIDYFLFVTPRGAVLLRETGPARGDYILWQSNALANGNGDYFLYLTDEGTLKLTAGTLDKPGKQIWSNNINDPLDVKKGGVNIERIDYDFEHVKSEPPINQSSESLKCINSTSTGHQCQLKLTLTFTKTHTFTFSSTQSIAIGYKSSVKVAAPGVGEASTEWSVTGTVSFSEGYSDADTQTKTFETTVTINVPGNTTYQVQLVGLHLTATIPFTYTGVATYKSGKTARLVGVPGNYAGADSGQFTAKITCVEAPGGCPGGAGSLVRSLPVTGTVVSE